MDSEFNPTFSEFPTKSTVSIEFVPGGHVECWKMGSGQGDRQSPAVELTHGADCSGSTRRGLRGWCVGTTDRKVTHLLG